MTAARRIAIVGAGGFGREVLDLLRAINSIERQWDYVGFVANATPEKRLLDRVDGKWLGDDQEFFSRPVASHFVVAIAEPEVRRSVAMAYEGAGLEPATLVHPLAVVSSDLSIGEGSIICALSSATTNVDIGRHVIVDRHVSIGHDVVIHDFSTLHPSSVLSGGVVIGEGARIGTGSCLLPFSEIGAGALVGAGAVVTVNVPDNAVVMGVPARQRRLQ